jgi:hypothetical protein
MKRQTPTQTQKETMPPQMRGLLPHAAVFTTPEFDIPSNVSAETRFSHDFSRVRTAAPATIQTGAAGPVSDGSSTGKEEPARFFEEEGNELTGESLHFARSEGGTAGTAAAQPPTSNGVGQTVIRGDFPRVSPREYWFFDGETPPNYTVSTVLSTNRSGGTFDWRVSPHLTLSSATNPTPTVTSAKPSAARRDAWISARHTDVSGNTTAASYRLTVLAPDSLNHLRNVDNADPTWGYESRIHYSILDQLGDRLPRDVPINEQFTTGLIADFHGMDWRRGAEGSALVNPADWNDRIQGETAGHTPPPVNPAHADAAVAVYHWDGDWRVGSLTIGDGRLVSSVTWQKNRGFARHT